MSVLFETSLGDLVVDLEVELCPKTSENFLKLCKIYYYNFCSFFNVQKDFIAQTGDPTDLGTGGESIYARLERSDSHPDYGNRYFSSELATQKAHKSLNHGRRGTLAMAVSEGKCASQFFFTLADGLNELDGKHVVFGRLVEGFETLEQINNALVDDQGRPLRDIRLRHVIVLDDPFDDPPGILIPPQSPAEPSSHQGKVLRVGDDEELDQELDPEMVEERRREREARAQALTLEMVGDLPFAEVAPPENILFVCKLNSITRSEDLELIFSRFGTILSCEVIKDAKTGDSLQYAFIEFDQREDAERAYFKMDGVLIDDRRIHVDFSQSVSKLHSDWIFKRTGKRVKPNQTYEQRPKKRQPSERSPPRARRDSKYEMSFDDADLIERSARRSDHRRHDDRRPHSSRDHRSNHRQDSRAHHDSRHDHSRRRSRSPARRHR
ncbi:Peptidyl-prolyl cis-trans isomerase cyp6 [Puccinia graminis f. sp. tritici]|nr:Peptidyl-prolyl cis-trans isomerase cyp6 [Puccinia graminis f. sp. tritici]